MTVPKNRPRRPQEGLEGCQFRVNLCTSRPVTHIQDQTEDAAPMPGFVRTRGRAERRNFSPESVDLSGFKALNASGPLLVRSR